MSSSQINIKKEASAFGSLFSYAILTFEPTITLRSDRHNCQHSMLNQQFNRFPFDPFHHIHHPF